MINREQGPDKGETKKEHIPVQDREQGFQKEGQGAEQREMGKEIDSLHATDPSRKTLNTDKPLDRETQRWEKHQAPGQRGKNSKILPGSQRQQRKKPGTDLANTGTGNRSEQDGKRRYKGDMGNTYAYENSEF